MYKKALGERSDRAWEDYEVAKTEAKRVVREVKEAEWVRCGKKLQANFPENLRVFQQKAKKESASRLIAGIERKDGKLLTDTIDVKKRLMEHFSDQLEGDRGDVNVVL